MSFQNMFQIFLFLVKIVTGEKLQKWKAVSVDHLDETV